MWTAAGSAEVAGSAGVVPFAQVAEYAVGLQSAEIALAVDQT